jgi:hypothetical protein
MLLLEHDNGSPEHLRIERGREAWRRLQKDQTWEDWMTVAVAVDIGRQYALNISGKNAPGGKGYNRAFSNWLRDNGFDNIDGAARKHMLDCYDQRAAIENWRAILTTTQRLKINHPTTVWRNWQSSTRDAKPKGEPKPSKLQQTEDALATAHEAHHLAEEENERLKAHIEELESAREREPSAAPELTLDEAKQNLVDLLKDEDKGECIHHIVEVMMKLGITGEIINEFVRQYNWDRAVHNQQAAEQAKDANDAAKAAKRKGGRPRGSKNKPKQPVVTADPYADLPPVTLPQQEPADAEL